ncbi:hypothetical protein MB901379_00513 [Mycobacterium basiliense]|uniref:Uncharacterized protein n=1 Tax=Mycobacterium basiliense TaxID=2094119 RepID=A0A3S4DQU1_9MYCO|nr:IniB N-terminal domain-containing protein [Mycobacterium basiliense]VDM86983.1 hypothetical protein MB901379_00513 [Mycobacterium basiliense]
MANSLLDFVIALVRDPEAAARYAADPAQAIADAHLANVTSADVNNLIPMVSDSLSMAGPAGAASGGQIADHDNVWASGAAAAALDAFSPHQAADVVHHQEPMTSVINQPAAPAPDLAPRDGYPAAIEPHEPSVLFTGAETADPTVDHGALPADDPAIWDHSVSHPHPVDPDHHGFDIHG